ncbi:MAG: 2-hydroxyacid dehydrogenase [Hyphomicrobiaceae bacterium]
MKKRLLVTRRLPSEIEARAARDYDARLNAGDQPYTTDDLVRLSAEHDAFLVCLTDKLPRDAIERMDKRLKIISTFSVGTEHIDIRAARERGIAVGNAPHGVTVATAEIAMLLILGAARRAPEGERMLFAREWKGWKPMELLGRRLDGKRLGILGLGSIGQAVARRARAFDMEIHYHNRRRRPPAEEQGAVYHSSFEDMLPVTDVLSIHAPSTPETRGMINARTLSLLPRGALVVNTARGDLVIDEDLIAALRSGQVGYAGLDVFAGEPNLHEGYRGLDNVFLLPHMGTSALEARRDMGFEALDNIDACFAGRPLPFPA